MNDAAPKTRKPPVRKRPTVAEAQDFKDHANKHIAELQAGVDFMAAKAQQLASAAYKAVAAAGVAGLLVGALLGHFFW